MCLLKIQVFALSLNDLDLKAFEIECFPRCSAFVEIWKIGWRNGSSNKEIYSASELTSRSKDISTGISGVVRGQVCLTKTGLSLGPRHTQQRNCMQIQRCDDVRKVKCISSFSILRLLFSFLGSRAAVATTLYQKYRIFEVKDPNSEGINLIL
ncbi:hypothetical protein QQG55_44585 [Brugia pahangi]|uniref:Uncharacterized protein n=1 Tax=Brugia pahangi TaxID=6280 RepID=A0A0N4TV40_BRUPA|nr:unnamed protein product [Brugia pahangi]